MKKSKWVVFVFAVLLVAAAVALPERDGMRVLGAKTGGGAGWVERFRRVISWKTHKNADYGYAIRFPKNWQIEERNTDNSRSFKVSQADGEAYVVISGFKDDALKEAGGLAKALKTKEAELKGDPEYKVANYTSGVEGETAGYMAVGRTKMGGREMAFMEKGLFGAYGKVLLMHGAALPEKTGEYESVLWGIMDSFKVF